MTMSKWIAWLQVVVAAVAMVMTIPGRTQGLGLITKQLLDDQLLQLDRTHFAYLNLLATIGGAIFALPFGWLIDRFGIRLILICNVALLGVATWVFAQAQGLAPFFAGMLLMRGLGQSALSASCLTLVGKWFPGRTGVAMAVFGVITTLGFIAIFETVRFLARENGWRATWVWLAYGAWVFAVVCWLACRNPVAQNNVAEKAPQEDDSVSVTWRAALRSPLFWLLALSCALFNWVSSGIGLFNEDVLDERGLGGALFERALGIMTLVSLLSNGLGGWLTTRWPLTRLMAAGMLMLAVCLGSLPFMTEPWHVYVNALFMGISAGMVMVVFFACWGTYFGAKHLGKIQGSAQALTVLSSALGPVSLALSKEYFGSYRELFLILAGLALLSALLCLVTRTPLRR